MPTIRERLQTSVANQNRIGNIMFIANAVVALMVVIFATVGIVKDHRGVRGSGFAYFGVAYAFILLSLVMNIGDIFMYTMGMSTCSRGLRMGQ